MERIKRISLPLPLKMGAVNCYLLKGTAGFILIDTGCPNQHQVIIHELSNAGCEPGDLKLIIITHGDFDHTGNAAHLRKEFQVPIAMHADDAGMAEYGDMFWNRKNGLFLLRAISRLIPRLFGFGSRERFKPDIDLQDGNRLTEYGLNSRVILLGGHSKGSIGIITDEGDLFCGDLFDNTRKPGFSAIMDDLRAAETSLEKLKILNIQNIYPGHGEPFLIDDLDI